MSRYYDGYFMCELPYHAIRILGLMWFWEHTVLYYINALIFVVEAHVISLWQELNF
jgi:hypothetical protein